MYDEQTRVLDLDSAAKTENSRSAYPVGLLPNFVKSGLVNAHPTTIVNAHRRCIRCTAADREADAAAGDVPLSFPVTRPKLPVTNAV